MSPILAKNTVFVVKIFYLSNTEEFLIGGHFENGLFGNSLYILPPIHTLKKLPMKDTQITVNLYKIQTLNSFSF